VTVECRKATDPTSLIDDGDVMLLWTDPPYGTQKRMSGTEGSYKDDGTADLILTALDAWSPKLHSNGTIAVCLDYRLVHYVASGMSWCLRGEIVWSFGLGRPRTSWWPVRHNTILTFTRSETSGIFNADAVPRVPRRAKSFGYPADKPAGSVWDYTMNNTHPDRCGYPNQKPAAIIEPFILAHTNPDDLIVDPFCGSGSVGVVALRNGRRFYGADTNIAAVVMAGNRCDMAVLS
jgi:DNA modification methylase